MKAAVRALHSSQHGAVAPLLLFVLLFFVWAAVGVLNTGQDTRDKVQAQNAVDAVSIAVADLAARDLNVMAMNQVAGTQSFTIAISSAALTAALAQTFGRTVMAAVESVTNCSLWPTPAFKYCLVYMTTMIGYATYVASIELRYRPERGVITGNRLTEALNRMSDHLVSTFPQRASELSGGLAQANGLEALFVYPVCDGSNGSRCQADRRFPAPSLPVEHGTQIVKDFEMCRGITAGSDGFARIDFSQHGFPQGSGPLKAGGSSSDPNLREHINKTSGLSRFLPLFYNTMRFAIFISYTPLSKHSYNQRADRNEFLDAFDAAWGVGCYADPNLLTAGLSAAGRSPVAAGLAAAAALTVKRPKNYWLKGRPGLASLSASFGMAGVTANSYGSNFEDFGFLYIAAREQAERSNRQAFSFEDEPFFAYAQSMVYNRKSHELYTGLWNGSLVPSSHMDRPDLVAAAMGRHSAHEAFQKLRRIMASSPGHGDWRDVNTH